MGAKFRILDLNCFILFIFFYWFTVPWGYTYIIMTYVNVK